MTKYYYIIIFSTLLSGCLMQTTDEVKDKLLSDWSYHASGFLWNKAYIPETIWESLKRDTFLTEEMYKKDNFLKMKWVDTVSWEYKTNFKLSGDVRNTNYELKFEQISGFADVFLNGNLIFTADNFYKEWIIDVTKTVKKGKNEITVKFKPFNDYCQTEKSIENKNLPFNGLEKLRIPMIYTDTTIGLGIVPIGLTGKVQLYSWSKAKINNVFYELIDLKIGKSAKIKATYNISSSDKQTVNILMESFENKYIDEKINLEKGKKNYTFYFDIKEPHLWWTYDIGTPYLYTFHTKIIATDKVIHKLITKYGIRKIEIDTTDNKFTLKLNNRKLYLKILDYYPIFLFPEEILNKSYSRAIDDAVKTGINMLHVSEKGTNEKEIFYEECDRQGILIWQDFMFPYKIFDTAKTFLELCKKEAEYEVKRLRNHPAIAFWSGQNNWKQSFDKYYKNKKQDSVILRQKNKQFFSKTLKTIVKKYDSTRNYFEAINFKSLIKIDEKLPEYPNINILKKILPEDNRKIENPILKFLSKPPNANRLIISNLKTKNILNTELSAFLYLSQMQAAKYYQKEIEKYRLNNEYTGINCGLYKDFSPLISTSAVDYYGNWKGKMYAISKEMKKLIVKFEQKHNGEIAVSIKSDFYEDITVDLYFKLYNTEGKVRWRENHINQIIEKQTAKKYFDFYLNREIARIGKQSSILKVEIFYKRQLYVEKYFTIVSSDKIKLETPQISKKFFEVDNGIVIELSTNKFVTDMMIYTEQQGKLSDNFITIVPGETRKIYFYTNISLLSLENSFLLLDHTKATQQKLFTNE